MQIDIQREVKSQNLQKQSNNNEDNRNINNNNYYYHHYNKNNDNDNNDYNSDKHNKQSYDNNNENNNNNDDYNNNYDITNLINRITFHVISEHFHIEEEEEVSKALYSMMWRAGLNITLQQQQRAVQSKAINIPLGSVDRN